MQVKRNKSVGLDIGQANTKVVCLAWKGRQVQLTRAEVFRSRDEGILGDDEAEQLSAVSGWLKELNLLDQRVVLGLPQYMATTQVSDFAKSASGHELAKMVQLETTQLSGISDDHFLHDYAVMPAGNGRRNPVLIGICRAANVEDYAGRAVDVSIKLEDVAMNALALANAFIQLKPDEARSAKVQFLLDIGTETTTLVIMAGGQVLYIGGIMFGGQNITAELARKLKLGMDDAERKKVKDEIDWTELALDAIGVAEQAQGTVSRYEIEPEGVVPVQTEPGEPPTLGLKLKLKLPRSGEDVESSGAPSDSAVSEESSSDSSSEESIPVHTRNSGILDCFNALCREITTCIEHWRSSENETLAMESVSRIWLSGASAVLKPLQNCLAGEYDCDVELLGPKVSEYNTVGVEFAVAYGLALQGIGAAALPISMAPDALSWMHRKEARGKYLVVALLILAIFAFGWAFMEYARLAKGTLLMNSELGDLKMSVRSIQKLDLMKREYCGILMQALPVVSSSCRTQKFMDVLAQLQTSVKSDVYKDSVSWCVYVADEDSFNELNEDKEAKVQAVPQASAAPMGRRQRRLLMDTAETPEETESTNWQKVLAEEAAVKETVTVKPLKRVYVVGVIMSKNDNHNVIERDIMLHLKGQVSADGKTPFFEDVQVMSEEERSKCASRAVLDWEKCFANMRTSEAFKSYDHKPFFWRVELKDPVVTPPGENPLFMVRKSKRKK